MSSFGEKRGGDGWNCDIIFALRILSNYASQDLAKRLSTAGVTVAEWSLLDTLGAGPEAPSELANVMGMSRGAITKLADRLIKKSLVRRKANKEEVRFTQTLALTKKGRALVPELTELCDKSVIDFFNRISVVKDRAHFDRVVMELVKKYRQDQGFD